MLLQNTPNKKIKTQTLAILIHIGYPILIDTDNRGYQ